jgi:undecaprenyl diphosphate synthase
MKNKTKIQHIVIIPDGNRRWAKRHGISPEMGHKRGIKTLEKILEKARAMDIKHFTFWTASWDNLTKRTKKEVNFLFKVLDEQFRRTLKDKRVEKNQVQVRVIGRYPEIFPKGTQKVIRELIQKTKNYKKYVLTFLLAYNGTDEMISCIQTIVNSKVRHITPKTIKNHLWTKDLPPVDLIIRTGCEDDPHMSAGFMMWDTTYSQLYFTKTLFPSFSPKEFEKIIKNYQRRDRRMGK